MENIDFIKTEALSRVTLTATLCDLRPVISFDAVPRATAQRQFGTVKLSPKTLLHLIYTVEIH